MMRKTLAAAVALLALTVLAAGATDAVVQPIQEKAANTDGRF